MYYTKKSSSSSGGGGQLIAYAIFKGCTLRWQ